MSSRNPFSVAKSSSSDEGEFNNHYDCLQVRLQRKRKPKQYRGPASAVKQAKPIKRSSSAGELLSDSRWVEERVKRMKKERDNLLINCKKNKNCKADDGINEAGSDSIRIEVAVNGIDVLSFKISPGPRRTSPQPIVKPKVEPKMKPKIKVEAPDRGRDGPVSQAPPFNMSQPRFAHSSRIQDLRVHLDNMRKKREVKVQPSSCSRQDDDDDEDDYSHIIGVEVEGGGAEEFSEFSTETADENKRPKGVGQRPGPVSSKRHPLTLKFEAPEPHKEIKAPISSPRTPDEDTETSDDDSIEEVAAFTKQDKIELVDIASDSESSDTEDETE